MASAPAVSGGGHTPNPRRPARSCPCSDRGGKTEAAFFPVLSRMLADGWSNLSVLYICPIKALLNNLEERLDRYCRLVGRQSAVWHGDIGASQRRRLLADPPDCLLTTPESLESMLVSARVDAPSFLAAVRAVVIDEVHAFAGDDRGWHLLSVLNRLGEFSPHPPQRIGLSATVGNPDELLNWLCADSSSPRFCSEPPDPASVAPELQIDFVGSLENAATVIARLHRGEKRLVFVDSRARAEKLGHLLQSADVQCFVTHSSLSASQRHDAERAFATRSNCVIVATSALELGIDIGDLDRVIQIDAPATVSSFLQRMGRTGRREGTVRNCLFLATNNRALVHAVGLLDLWASGFIEPVKPPPLPYHILAQQLMALALQSGGVERAAWTRGIAEVIATAGIDDDALTHIVTWMLEQDILWEESGVLWFGEEGNARYSRRHYMELLSVFTSPPLIRVVHGRRDLGLIDQLTLISKHKGDHVVLLGGRAWAVTDVDWTRRVAHVVPSGDGGSSRWMGDPQGLSFTLTQQIRRSLLSGPTPSFLSKRASNRLLTVRREGPVAADADCTVITRSARRWEWWTFGGLKSNVCLAGALQTTLRVIGVDSLSISMDVSVDGTELLEKTAEIKSRPASEIKARIDERALRGLKFAECLPPDLCSDLMLARISDDLATQYVTSLPIRLST
jgi:ATP-dependent Lhr-like helicase